MFAVEFVRDKPVGHYARFMTSQHDGSLLSECEAVVVTFLS